MPPGDNAPRLQSGNARIERLDAHRWAIVLPEVAKGRSELRLRF
jgi:hypothetical protein